MSPWQGRSEDNMGTQACDVGRKEEHSATYRWLAVMLLSRILVLVSILVEWHAALYSISILMIAAIVDLVCFIMNLHVVFVSVTHPLGCYFLQLWATQLQGSLQWMSSLEE